MVAAAWFLLLTRAGQFSLGFPNGIKVSLVAVGHPKIGFWSPSGKRLAAAPPELTTSGRPLALQAREFLFRIDGASRPPSLAMQVVGGPVWPLNVRKGKNGWYAVGVAGHSASVADIRIGLTQGDWQRLGAAKRIKGGAIQRTGVGFMRMARPDDLPGGRPRIIAEVVLPVDPNTHAFRVLAIDTKGKEMPSLGWATSPGQPTPDRYWFAGRYEAISRVELQTRLYVWKTLHGVHL